MGLKSIQTNFTSGVMDPKLFAREDITFYYNALKNGNNLIIMPSGGAKARPGKQHVGRLRPGLTQISLAGATVTAPQGGTAASVSDGNPATVLTTANNLAATDPFVICKVDFGADKSVAAIDIVDFRLSSNSLTGEIRIQFSADDTAWTDYATPFDWDSVPRTRRRSPAAPVSARYWRVVRIGTTSIAATAMITDIKFWEHLASLSPVRLMPFAAGSDEAYMFAVTDGHADVYVGRNLACGVALPHTGNQLARMTRCQSYDTQLLFHPDVAPHRIFRQGGDDEFDSRPQTFQNVPKHDYGAGTGGINEVQRFNVAGQASGDKITILLEGERTSAITIGATGADTATNIQTALRALNNTSATGITVSTSSGFDVTFGGQDGSRPWDEMSVTVLSGDGVWDVSRVTEGDYPGEPIMSAARGYPRCGTFYQQRLHLGGFKGVPNAIAMSAVGEYFNYDITRDDATKALMFRADTDQATAIYGIFAGRHLTFFCNDCELYIPTEPISDASVLKLTTRTGSKEGMPQFEVDGAIIFVQGVKDARADREVGTSIREFLFVDTEQSYSAALLSKLSSHLIRNPVDFALRKAVDTDEADICLFVNDDGSAVAYTVLRNDAVNAFMPVTTRAGDKILACGVDKKRRVYFAVERTVNGQRQRFIEMWNEDLYFDSGDIVTITAEEQSAVSAGQTAFSWSFDNPADLEAIGVRINGGRLEPADFSVDGGSKTITLGASAAELVKAGSTIRIASMVKSVTGLDYLEGETVGTYVDGTPGEALTVTGGTLNLADYADTEIQFGFEIDVSGAMMDFRIPQSETLVGKKLRVVNAFVQLYETASIQIRANNGQWRDAPLIRFDTEVLDRSQEELKFTGTAKMIGLTGWAEGGALEFRRPAAGPFTLLSITREITAS